RAEEALSPPEPAPAFPQNIRTRMDAYSRRAVPHLTRVIYLAGGQGTTLGVANRTVASGVLVVLVSLLADRLVHHREHLPAAAVAEVAPEQHGRQREEDDIQVGGVVPADVGQFDL